MLLMHRGQIFWFVHATILLTLLEVAEFSKSCDQNCAFLKAFKCIFLQKPVYVCAKDDVPFPPSVSALLENLPPSIKDSILNGSFKAQNFEDLVNVSPSLLNLIPANQIHFSAENVSSFLQNHSHESSVAKKLIGCLNSSLERKSFLENWNGDESNPKIEDIVASALTKWRRGTDWIFLVLVGSNTTVLFHVPPQFLLTFGSKAASEFLFHLGAKFNSLPQGQISRVFRNLDSKNSKFVRRAWAVLAVREFPEKIKWTKYSFVSPGLTLDELKNLEVDEIKPFLSYDFRATQVRIIFSKILVPWQVNINHVSSWIKYLSPPQTQTLWRSNFIDIGIKANETASYATAKQILLYQLHKINEKSIGEGSFINLTNVEDLLRLSSGFASILPLKTIQELSRFSVLTLDSLQKIDSNLMSLSAAYYLTDESNIFNLKKPEFKMTGIRGMLKAIPTSKIIAVKEEMSSILLHHLLQHLQGDNILRNLELLKKCRPNLGNAEFILKYLLENKDKNDYFSLLSPKDVDQISLSTINSLARDKFGQRVKELPHHILAAVLSNNSPASWTWNNMLNSSNAFHSLILGLNCNEMRKIKDTDFISIIGRYNDDRLRMGKVFPKNLQRCGQFALSNYLLLKSTLYNEPELIDLLEPSDIEAVGGYILASLPAEEILQAKYSVEIISAIGQLSLPELMLATSRDHLNALTEEYLNKDVKLSDLLVLRNLIHFIPASNLGKIGPKDMKYIIESDMIDKRLCADSETRTAWSNLLISTFGLPTKWNASQLESVGDLMIPLSFDQLNAIHSSQWQILADVAVTKYTELIEWPKAATFYQACLSTLIKSEQKSYLDAIKSLQRKYFIEVQKLVSSIKLNVKDDSIVLMKTNGSSFKSLPKPKIITPDEEYDISEEIEDENSIDENSAEFQAESIDDSEETFLYPTTPEQSVASSTSEAPSKSTSAPPINQFPSEASTLLKPSLISVEARTVSRNYNSNLNSSQYSESLKTKEKQEYESSEVKVISEHSEELLTASSSPVVMETSTTILYKKKVAPPKSLTNDEEEYNTQKITSDESSSFTDFTKTLVTHPTTDHKSQIDLETTRIPPRNFSYLSKDTFPKEEEDASDNNSHPKVVEPPEPTKDDSRTADLNKNPSDGDAKIGHSNLAVDADSMADATDTVIVLSLSDSEKSNSKEQVVEKNANRVASSSFSTEEPNSDNHDRGPASFFMNIFKINSFTEAPATTKVPSFDNLGLFLFGPDVVKEAKKLGQGFENYFGRNKAQESQTISTVAAVSANYSMAVGSSELKVTDLSEETRQSNEDGRKVFSAKIGDQTVESTDFSTTTISTNPMVTSSRFLDAFDDATTSSENPVESTVENHSKKITVTTPTTNAPLKQQDLKSEEIISLTDFIDFNLEPENMTFLDSFSDFVDYEQPQAEVYDGENDSQDVYDPYHGHAVDLDFPSEEFPPNIAKRHMLRLSSDLVSKSKAETSLQSEIGFKQSVPRVRRSLDSTQSNVFCDSVKVLGHSAVLALQDSDLHSVNNDELLNCVEDLGKLNFHNAFKELIWQRVKSLEVAHMAIGTLVGAWKLDDISNMLLNISEDWTLETIHLLSKYNADRSVGEIIVDKMRRQIFSNETITEVPEAVMVAMGPLLCSLEVKELQLMFQTPGTFMHVIPIISEVMQDCQMECLSKFARLAVAFMDLADSWTSDMVASLGPIPAGLDAENWKLLMSHPRAISGLQPRALECLPQALLKMMTPETMSLLPPLTTKVLTNKQLTLLDIGQKDVLLSIKNENWSLRNISTGQRSNIDKTPSPNVEVDLSSSCYSIAPSIIVVVFLLALRLFC